MGHLVRRSQRWFPRATGLGFVLGLALIGAGCGEAVDEPAPAPTVDEEYRSFVGRYLADPLEGDAMVRLRDLPPEANIPFPEAAILVGSVERFAEAGLVVTVLVDLPGVDLEDGETTFREAFEAAGWHLRDIPILPESYAEDIRDGGGSYTVVCDGEERFATVMTMAGPEGTVRGRITVAPSDPPTDLCGRPTFFGSTTGPILARFGQPDPFPVLVPPADADVSGPMRVSSGLASASRSHIVTVTPASNLELLGHYGDQLRGSLWTEIASGTQQGAAWSLWRFGDRFAREWTAVLSVIDQEAEQGVVRMEPELRIRVVTVEALPLGHSMPKDNFVGLVPTPDMVPTPDRDRSSR